MPGKGPPGRRNDSKHFKHEKRRRELQKKERRDARAKAVAGRTPTADFAQDLLEAAKAAPTTEGRTSLAQEALRTDPDCADAWVFLAEIAAATPEERLEHLQQAVEAGLRILGPEGLGAAGLGEQPLAQPYLRARCALAEALTAVGRADDAVAHYEDLLRLNPADDQGVRYALCATLLGLHQADAARALLAQLTEETAESLYLQALLAFSARGDTPEARDLVGRARAASARIGDLVLGRTPPAAVGLSDGEDAELDADEDEDDDGDADAVRYVRQTLARWQSVPGALDWLKQVVGD